MKKGDGEEAEKKRSKRKKRKNPFAPKQPPSAYNLFVRMKMEEYKNKYGQFNQKDVMRRIGQEWKTEPNKDRFKQVAKLGMDGLLDSLIV